MVGDIPADFIVSPETGDTEIAPERFKSAAEVQDACNELVAADRLRMPYRTAVDGLVDGNPTYRLGTMRAKGQSWRSRVNYRGSEGLLQARQTPFYDLVSEVDPCVELGLDYGKGQAQQDWANEIAVNFHHMLMRSWRSSFNYHVPLQQLEMLKHGIGYHIFGLGNKFCWYPDTPLTGHCLFPDGATLDVKDKLDYMMIRDFYPGHAIYKFIRNEEVATALGWNVDSTWAALAQTSKTQRQGSGSYRYTIEEYQREMRSGDIGTSNARQSGLWLNFLICKEIETGNMSLYITAEGVVINPNKKKYSTEELLWKDCLFRKRNIFAEWPFVMFPYDIGNGGIHSVRGLAERTKDYFELMNRVTNAMADQILMGATMMLKQNGDVDPDKLKLWKAGIMSIIPRNLEPSVVQFPPLQQGPLAFQQYLAATMQQNNQAYVQNSPEPLDRETAQSYAMRMQNQGQVSKGVHAQYASNWQMFLERMFRVAVRPEAAIGNSYSAQLAREFQLRCFKAGVPPEALRNVYEVNEVLSTGAGSAAARLQALDYIFKVIYPTTSEQKKVMIERDIVATVVSGTKVDRYARSLTDTQIPDSDMSIATLENNAMMLGGDALATSEQNQVEHMETHMPKANEVVQTVMQGGDPRQGLVVMQKFGVHLAQHLQFMSQNPMQKQKFEAFKKEFLAFSQIADKLSQQVKANQAAIEARGTPQQQVSESLQLGLAKVQANERIGQAKVASNARVNLSKAVMDARIKALEVGANRAAA